MVAKKYGQLPLKQKLIAVVALCLALLVVGAVFLVASQDDRSEVPAAEAAVAPEQVAKTDAKAAKKPLWGSQLYVEPESRPAQQATAWRTSQPAKAAQMDRLAALPVAHWLTSPEAVATLPRHIAKVGSATTVLVSYYLPYRDCGRYSAGGAQDAAAYKKFITDMAAAIGQAKAVVIVEPDAIATLKSLDERGQPCLQGDKQQMYYALISYAVNTLKTLPNTLVYIDAGHSMWVKDTAEVAGHLDKVDIKRADGFSLNVSNFQPTGETIRYGEAISVQIGGKHFVIDTSRNGLGAYTNKQHPTQSWCNPPGRALGHYPTTNVSHALVDAYLHIKRPGESDGADPVQSKCFGGPKAGEWWPEYALGLVERWPKHLQP